MSEMMGVEQEQAKTTKGLAETTKAVKGVESTIADGDRSVSAKLSMIGRVLSIESPAEKAARQQAQEQATAAAANAERLQQLLSQGNATEEEALAAQEEATRLAKEAEEAAEKRSMFDRFGSDDAPPTPTPDGGDGGGDASGGGFMKTFGKFFKMLSGFVGILMAVAIPALALILNSPIFETLKKALFDFVDFFFETVVPLLKKAYTYMKEEVFPALQKAFDDLLPMLKSLWDDVLMPLYNWFVDFMSKEGGGIDIMLEYIQKQWVNVKKLFQSMIDLFKNLMAGDFEKAFGNLGDIGKTLMDAIDNALTAILKLGLAAFGLTFDGSIGDLISNWLTSTWESIKGALRSVFESVGFDAPEMLQAGSAEQRAETAAAQGDIEAAEDEKDRAQRGMRGAAISERQMGRIAQRRRDKLAELEKEAEEKGGFDKLEQSKLVGLSKNDIIEARELLAQAEERERKAKEKTAMLNKQLADAETKKAEAEERLANVGKKVQKDADARDKATTLRELPPSEAEKATEVNKAANDNKASNIVVQQNDQSSTAQTEQKTVIENNKSLSPDARTSKLLDFGVF